MDRRDFLGGTLALPALALLGRAPTAAAALYPAPIGLPQAGLRFGYAAITWAGDDLAAIDEIAAVGYQGIQLRATAVERWGSDPAALRRLLSDKGLEFVALSSGVLALDPAREADSMALHTRHARFAAAAGCRFLGGVDERPRARDITPADHARMGGLLTTLGRRCADLGVQLSYHNHMGNLGQAPEEVAAVLSYADPALVGLQLDTAHWRAAGGDAVRAVQAFGPRIVFLHLKDVQFGVDGRPYKFCELGEGEADVLGVLRALDAIGFEGWGVVELDYQTAPDRSPRRSAELSADFLVKHGYRV
jgi:inosose dehydratase